MNSFGSICPKRSSTPRSPKSGEQDDQIAPIEVAASIAAIASGMFGSMAATRSPTPTPDAFIACCRRETSACSCAPGQLAGRLVLAPEDDCGAVVGAAQQVLGEIEPGVGKELGAGHLVGIDQDAGALIADHAAKVPDKFPERGALRDRPGMQIAIALQIEPAPPVDLAMKLMIRLFATRSGDGDHNGTSVMNEPSSIVAHSILCLFAPQRELYGNLGDDE